MDYSHYILLKNLKGNARKELKSFIEYLYFKHKINKDLEKGNSSSDIKQFNAFEIDTMGYKFNRDEANER
jgi:hypothetical protein